MIIRLMKNTLKTALRNMYISFIRVPTATFYIIYKFSNKRFHYIVICDHIGDSLIAFGYLEQYCRQRNIHKAVIVTTKRMVSLTNCYKKFGDHLMILSSKQLKFVLEAGKTNFGNHVIEKLKHITFINPSNEFTSEFLQYPSRFPMLSLKDCIKYGELGLNEDTIFNPPIYKTVNIEKEFQDLRLKRGRTVILAPYEAKAVPVSLSFFDLLAENLINKGFRVLTNVTSSKQRIVKGSSPLLCDIGKMAALSEFCGWVIGVRSGLFDLLSYAECHLIVLYAPNNIYFNFFRLAALENTKAAITEYRLINEKNDVAYIGNYVN